MNPNFDNDNHLDKKDDNDKKNHYDNMKETFHKIWILLKDTLTLNDVMIFLLRVFIIFIIISFVLYLILKNEKPGIFEMKSAFVAFLIAIFHPLIRAFILCLIHFYLKSFTSEYLENKLNEKTLQKIGVSENDKDILQNLDNIKSIFIVTVSLAISAYISNFIKIIVVKAVLVKDIFTMKSNKKRVITPEEFINTLNSPFLAFLGSILGGIVFMIFYFFNQQQYMKGSGIGPNIVLQRAYGDKKSKS